MIGLLTSLPYYILGEVITCILCLVLFVNIIATFSPSEWQHRMFFYADVSTFFAALFNIAAVFCIAYYKNLPLQLCTFISTMYFILLLVAPLFLSCYAVNLAFAHKKYRTIGIIINFIIYGLYFLVIILNIKIGWVFKYDPELGYVKGFFKSVTYITTGVYGIVTMISIALNRKSMAFRVFVVFLCYPLLSLSIVSAQFFLPNVILTGTSSFAAMLLTYMSIQSDLLEYDIVTGLMTARKLSKFIEQKNKQGVLYVLSIDNMNNIQNNMEISAMNKMLLNLGKEFSKVFGRYAYHMTTNRFAGIAPDIQTVNRIHERIKKFINELNKNEGKNLPSALDVYYVAVGFSKGEKTSTNVMELVNNLLMKTQLSQNHELKICDESILESLERKRQIFNILKRELDVNSKQFQVWYQPIHSISENKFTYMEALARLQNTELGNISPQEFVEVAENKGLIEQLGFVTFQKVCKFIAENKDVVSAVSVNFSVFQMMNPDVVNNVLSTIRDFNILPSNIIIEITESTFIDNFALVNKHMQELASAGVKFYLDDFGTGYSNLSNVITLPFSTIKFDRSLVLVMEKDSTRLQFFYNLVDTFKNAGLKILVEGVETENQNNLVQNAAIDYIQGYYYSKPVPAEKCIELLRS